MNTINQTILVLIDVNLYGGTWSQNGPSNVSIIHAISQKDFTSKHSFQLVNQLTTKISHQTHYSNQKQMMFEVIINILNLLIFFLNRNTIKLN